MAVAGSIRTACRFAMFTLDFQTDSATSVQWRRSSDVDLIRLKQRTLLWMLFWSAFAGFISGTLQVRDAFDCLPLVAALAALAALAYRWCDADARLRRFAQWEIFVPALYVFPGPLLVVPMYLAATRRMRCLRSMMLAAVYLFVMVSVAIVSNGVGRLFFH